MPRIKLLQLPLLRGAPLIIYDVETGYTNAGQLLVDARRESVFRPTELDAILSIMRGHTVTSFSLPAMSYGDDRVAYSKPARTERERQADRGYKWCDGSHSGHAPGWVPLYDFYANRARPDGYDNLCAACRRASNAAQYEARRGKATSGGSR